MLFRRRGGNGTFWGDFGKEKTKRFENHKAKYFISFLKKHMFYMHIYEHTQCSYVKRSNNSLPESHRLSNKP